MSTSVTLPALGESVTEGTVTRWLKQPGDSVDVDEPLLEVSTDKVDTEIPSPVAGTLLEIKVGEDETVEVGAELATVGDSSEGDDSSDDDSDQIESEQTDSEEKESEQTGGSGGEGGDGASEAESQEGSTGEQQQPEDESEGEDQSSGDQAAETTEKSEDSSGSGGSGGGSSGGGSGGGTSVKLPELGESVTEGTVTRWLKEVGDSVEVDEPLLEVSTDKVDTEIPSPVAGTLLEIKVSEDETVDVGAELATVGDADAAPADGGGSDDQAAPATEESEDSSGGESEPEPEPESKPESEPESEPAKKQADETPREGGEEPVSKEAPSHGGSGDGAGDGGSYVTPLVRKLAAKHDVDLSGISGTGVGGRIRKQDVLAAAEQATGEEAPAEKSAAASTEKESADTTSAKAPAAEVSPLRGTTVKMSRLRKVIASRMVESLQTSAQLTTVVEVDITAIARLRAQAKDQFAAREGVKLSFLPFFARAAIDALKTYPQVNASIDTDKGEVTYHDGEHLGVAVDTERGLLVPVIKDAGDLSLGGLARKIADIATRTRDSKIGPDELSGGTFTLTNTGSRGALFDTPIINQPQVGILGTGTVVKRPVVIDDDNLGETIAVRQMVYLALTYDHRLVDGADAARFLSTVKQRLEEADFAAELGL